MVLVPFPTLGLRYLLAIIYEGDNFGLDGQGERAATKLCNAVLSSTLSASRFLLQSAYLRLLSANSSPPTLALSTWHNISAVVLLLEWCAALMVKRFVQTEARGDVNANLSRAVTEAIVAVQVGEMIAACESCWSSL